MVFPLPGLSQGRMKAGPEPAKPLKRSLTRRPVKGDGFIIVERGGQGRWPGYSKWVHVGREERILKLEPDCLAWFKRK